MYYLFIRTKEKLEAYKVRIEITKKRIARGKTPVFN